MGNFSSKTEEVLEREEFDDNADLTNSNAYGDLGYSSGLTTKLEDTKTIPGTCCKLVDNMTPAEMLDSLYPKSWEINTFSIGPINYISHNNHISVITREEIKNRCYTCNCGQLIFLPKGLEFLPVEI